MEELEFYQGQHTGEEIDDAVDTVQLGLKTVNGFDLHGEGEIYVGSEGAQQAADEAAASAAAAQAAAESIDPDTLNARIYAAFPHDTASGNPAAFPDGADGIPVKSLIAQIEPAQAGSGDPSPTNVRPISGISGLSVGQFPPKVNSFTSSGTVTQNANNSEVVIVDQTTINVKGKSAGTYPSSKQLLTALPLVSGKTYILTAKANIASGKGRIAIRNSANQNVISSGTFTDEDRHSLIFTYGGESGYYLSFFANWGASGGDVTYYDITLEEAISVSWGTEAGTVYGGTLDVATGVLTIDRVYAEFSGGFELYPYDNHFFFRSVGSFGDVVNNAIVCDQFPQSEISKSNTNIGINVINSNGFSDARIMIRPEGYATMTAAQFNSMLASAPVHVAYRVTNPQTYQLAPHEITTLLGENIFAAAPDDLNVVVDYRADPTLYISKINAPADDDMIADANIASGQYFIVNNTLYLSTAAIASGAAIVPGTNCTQTNLAAALNALNT